MITREKVKEIVEDSTGFKVQNIMNYKNLYVCSVIPRKFSEEREGSYLDGFFSVNKVTGKCEEFQPFEHMDFIKEQTDRIKKSAFLNKK